MGDAPIRTEQLRKSYGTLVAVDGLDLEVRQGEFFGLLGPNGAGKSTTIGMLTTTVVPTGGRALVSGLDVSRHAADVKRQIGVVSQANTLDRALTVWENLYYHGRFFGVPRARARARADELLEQFSLTERADSMVFELSGGLAQRLMMARALAHEPQVLFLDEPTSGIDPADADQPLADPRGPQPRRADDPPHDALHGGGRRALRAGRDHRPRQGARRRHAGRAEARGTAPRR